jgi:alpha-L-fucosidase
LLIVDRTVHGRYENYQTPEQRVPDRQLNYPWETCMTLGDAWGYVPNEHFKSSSSIIHSLIEIVAKGGSLLLGIGPRADGTLQEEAVQRLKEIGSWMKINGGAIYNTRTIENFKDGNTWFTKSKTGELNYALACFLENQPLPAYISWRNNVPQKGSKMKLLQTGETVKWVYENEVVKVFLPKSVTSSKTSLPALALSFVPVR